MERWPGCKCDLVSVRKSCCVSDVTRQYVGGVEFKFKIFWVDSDVHVRAMFELHRWYGSRDVIELLIEMQTVNVDAGGSTSSSRGGPGAIIAAPI
ncbi:hypothetical protein PIB30_060918 [Stylosanthes scabra]|uniref:Uncharacterized protein n=1 Tax=Stylosanthes scabra TaxID=79078 RepID=A0ABU6QKK7_9FABA|nr:hypothetical protein [Stylosanthes scabra]